MHTEVKDVIAYRTRQTQWIAAVHTSSSMMLPVTCSATTSSRPPGRNGMLLTLPRTKADAGAGARCNDVDDCALPCWLGAATSVQGRESTVGALGGAKSGKRARACAAREGIPRVSRTLTGGASSPSKIHSGKAMGIFCCASGRWPAIDAEKSKNRSRMNSRESAHGDSMGGTYGCD